MIYLTGPSGMVGSRILESYPEKDIVPVSYRNEIPDVFESHKDAVLIHTAWSCNTRTSFDELERVYNDDLFASQKLFQKFSEKNPNGKIIFLSTAGAVYKGYDRVVREDDIPNPVDLYGQTKMQVETILRTIKCRTVSLRISNVWGSRNLPESRQNGLIDKLISSLDTDKVNEIYANLNTRIDIIHVDDLVDLIFKIADYPCIIPHQMYLVGGQSLTIKDVLDKITAHGTLLLRLRKSETISYLQVENFNARKKFDWNPKHKL